MSILWVLFKREIGPLLLLVAVALFSVWLIIHTIERDRDYTNVTEWAESAKARGDGNAN